MHPFLIFCLAMIFVMIMGQWSSDRSIDKRIKEQEEEDKKQAWIDLKPGQVLDGFKKCPNCLNKIKAKATVCKHCKSKVNETRDIPDHINHINAESIQVKEQEDEDQKQAWNDLKPGQVLDGFKKCPNCLNKIKAKAIVCKHCKSKIDDDQRAPNHINLKNNESVSSESLVSSENTEDKVCQQCNSNAASLREYRGKRICNSCFINYC